MTEQERLKSLAKRCLNDPGFNYQTSGFNIVAVAYFQHLFPPPPPISAAPHPSFLLGLYVTCTQENTQNMDT